MTPSARYWMFIASLAHTLTLAREIDGAGGDLAGAVDMDDLKAAGRVAVLHASRHAVADKTHICAAALVGRLA